MSDLPNAERGTAVTPDVLAEFERLAEDLDAGAMWSATVDAFGEYLHEGPGLDPWRRIAGRIADRVDAGRSASFIRLGDGEGNLLASALGEYPALTEHCLARTSLRHLGDSDLLGEALPEALADLRAALAGAELIGFPGPFGARMLLARTPRGVYLRPAQGLIAVQRYLARSATELGLGAKTGAPAGFHRGLLPHYEELIRGRRVGIVTCHVVLERALADALGARAVDLRPVPPQATIGADGDNGHWPDRYRGLLAELRRVEAGWLWFVAAGVLGKAYCEALRGAGAIAVDIGHTADIWAGVASRSYDQRGLLDAWSIA